jgi:hypothetical protein
LIQGHNDKATHLEYNNTTYITSVNDSESEERSGGSVGKGKEEMASPSRSSAELNLIDVMSGYTEGSPSRKDRWVLCHGDVRRFGEEETESGKGVKYIDEQRRVKVKRTEE